MKQQNPSAGLTNKYLLQLLNQFSPSFCGLNNLSPGLYSKKTFSTLINDNNHFLAIFKKETACYYYDPFGLPPSTPSIQKFLLLHKGHTIINHVTHQDLRSKYCGFFVLFFILRLDYNFLNISFIPFHPQNLLFNDSICVENLSSLIKIVSTIHKTLSFAPRLAHTDKIINLLYKFIPHFLGVNPTYPPFLSNYACLFKCKETYSALIVSPTQNNYYSPGGDFPPNSTYLIKFLEQLSPPLLYNLHADISNSSPLSKILSVHFILCTTYPIFKLLPFIPHNFKYNEKIARGNVATFSQLLPRLQKFVKKAPATIDKIPVFLLK